ncbi:hypothetical protein KAW80_03565 [Candidatus Babeliales bacterium]|nr:hypothetical protein [Candidatus Babeliales bacterium]
MKFLKKLFLPLVVFSFCFNFISAESYEQIDKEEKEGIVESNNSEIDFKLTSIEEFILTYSAAMAACNLFGTIAAFGAQLLFGAKEANSGYVLGGLYGFLVGIVVTKEVINRLEKEVRGN